MIPFSSSENDTITQGNLRQKLAHGPDELTDPGSRLRSVLVDRQCVAACKATLAAEKVDPMLISACFKSL